MVKMRKISKGGTKYCSAFCVNSKFNIAAIDLNGLAGNFVENNIFC
jgi:hypothetical protein